MKSIRSLIGRRQFLVTAGAASASALALKNFVTGKTTAMASSGTGPGETEGVINNYPNLLSPLKVRNRILKNRILHPPSPPHLLQGPENYPADSFRSHYSQMAKNAALVTVTHHFGQYPKTYNPEDRLGMQHMSDDNWEDIPPVHNYIDQMIEDIHCEGSLVILGKKHTGTVEEIVAEAKEAEQRGYDVFEFGERKWCGENKGDSLELMRADLKLLERIRKETNLLLLAVILPCRPGISMGPSRAATRDPAGPRVDEVVEMAKELEGLADILRMKDAGMDTNHPNPFVMEKGKPIMLPIAQAIKESGAKILVAPNGGFHDPAMNEDFIASGKTDLITMATPLFADPKYVQKAHEGRGEDIVPCIMCHDCHGICLDLGPWRDVCSVNPLWGLSETKKKSIRASSVLRKIAVVGGGPAGMKAAITAAERGHKVTLYEKNDSLGGLLRHTDFSQWKWAQKNFKDYLVRQTYKAGVDVVLGTDVTPDKIEAGGYDTVLVATGATPVIPRLPGADGKNVFNVLEAYSNKKSLGEKVVLIGGGVYGTETGISLALSGHKVTALTTENFLIPPEVIGAHNKGVALNLIENHENFSYVLEAVTTDISGGKVTYKDATGSEKSIRADSVVIYAGLSPRMDEAMAFSRAAGQVIPLGDCTGRCGTIQKTIRSAFFAASQV